jgi:UDP-glucose:(heptosyl)LPS alpha-1,3-glucosyltransferase
MVRDHFRRFYPEVPRDEVFVVRSAIDPKRFPEIDRLKCREEFRKNWDIPSSSVVGLLAAMNYRLKGLDPLLHAVKRLLTRPEFVKNPPDFRLVVAGSLKNMSYRRQAARLGIDKHVVFVGHRDDMRTGYFAADFLVHPTFYDPCSLVVLEALACGLPVITTRYNGASELLHVGKDEKGSQEGYVIDDPHDHERLATCMVELLDSGRRNAFSQAARRTASRWTFEHHYRQLLNVFAAAMARKEAA